MSAVFSWIENKLSPPGIHQEHRRRLFMIIGRIGQQIADDVAIAKREFFAYSVSGAGLNAHGAAKNVPRLPFDTDESFRARLVNPAQVLSSLGEETALAAFLNSYMPGRWLLQDTTRDNFRVGSARVGSAAVGRTAALVLYLTDLIPQERANISAFLDWFLGADIEYTLLRQDKQDEGAISRFLDSFVPGRWEQIDKTKGYFKVGSGSVGTTPVASEVAVEFRIMNLTDEERTEIEEFLDWYYAGNTEYEVVSTSAA